MLHDPHESGLFPRLSPDEIALLSAYGHEVTLADGEALVEQGRQPYRFWVILEGEVRVTKRAGGEELLLTVHRAGEFAAEIGILAGAVPYGTARAVGPVRALRIERDRLRELIASNEAVAALVVPALTRRSQEVQTHLQQQDKLAALGRMAAGLAHELNNPAAAVRRAAAQLAEAIADAQQAALRLHAFPLTEAQQALLATLHDEARECCAATTPLAPLDRAAREDEVADWLDARGVAEPWALAASLVTAGVEPDELDGIEAVMGDGATEWTARWLAATVTTASLIQELRDGTDRISTLVGSIKVHSHMDQAPELKETDLHAGLESTLSLLAHALRGRIEVVRDYDPALPPVCMYPGEINQVWTNLIDNAAAAMRDGGTLTLRTRLDAGLARVEVIDTGPGIAPEIVDRIWEPFFTTKGVGEGSGLGLDVVRRVVTRRHGGSVRVDSRPGETRFTVTLRVEGPPRTVVAAPDAEPESG